MSKEDKTRNFIYIDNEDFEFYQELKQSHYFNDNSIKNIDLFVFATLVGLNVVGKPEPLDNAAKKKDYIRVNDNKTKEGMIILKALAISKFDDVNVLSDENKLFSLCEDYANSGIKRINVWCNDKEESFDNILTKELLKSWDMLDFDKIKDES
jgi:hypothetical protein